MRVDIDLIRKYAVAGPRYTSYPTAVQFKDGVTMDELRGSISRDNESGRDVSLYFHLPFCDTLCWFCGCTTVITRDRSVTAGYLDRIEREMDGWAKTLASGRRIVQIHFGGGTPTYLDPGELRRLGRMIRDRFAVADDVEFGIEMDPRELTRDHVAALREIGCNRASMGVQDNDPAVQQAVNRIQPFALTSRVVSWIRDEGIGSLNIDLIYGLPRQSVASFMKTLDEILSLAPERFAVFNYAHVPWLKPSQKLLAREGLPSPDEKLEILKSTIERLTGAGYVYIGMDHFAKPDDELTVAQKNGTLQRNFQGYSTRANASILGSGVSAITQTRDGYFQNEKSLEEYYERIDNGDSPVTRGYILTRDDEIRRTVIMRLMCDMKLAFSPIEESTGIGFRDYFAQELVRLSPLEEDGLIESETDGLRVTDEGRLLIRNIAMTFDAYLGGGERRFSKTI